MDVYLIAKFIHIAGAALWVGGGVAMTVLGVLAARARDPAEFIGVFSGVLRLAPRIYLPCSVLVLLSGLAMIWLGGWVWEAWLVIGTGGIAAVTALGAGLLGPLSERVVALGATPGRKDEAVALGRRLLRLAKVDHLLQFTVVFVMVVKPGWSDAAVLGGLAALVIMAALLLSRPVRFGTA